MTCSRSDFKDPSYVECFGVALSCDLEPIGWQVPCATNDLVPKLLLLSKLQDKKLQPKTYDHALGKYGKKQYS